MDDEKIQQIFLEILHDQKVEPKDIADLSSALTTPDRITIYKNNGQATLLNVLKTCLPCFFEIVGYSQCLELTQEFQKKHRPQSFNLNDIPGKFLDFCKQHPLFDEHKIILDLLRFETQLELNFHIQDSPKLSLQQLQINLSKHSKECCLTLQPSTTALSFNSSIYELHQDLKEKSFDFSSENLSVYQEHQHILIYRNNFSIHHQIISKEDYFVFKRVEEPQLFLDVCCQIEKSIPNYPIDNWLLQWYPLLRITKS